MPRNAPGLKQAFTHAEGIAAGLTPDELRYPGWSAPFRALRSFEEPTSVQELAAAYSPHLRPGRFFSHTTAAVSHGIWLPMAHERRMEVHVAVLPGQRQPRGRDVRGHLLVDRPGLVTERNGLPVAGETETWCQLATILGMDDLVVAGESLLAKNRTERLPLRALAYAVAAGDRPRQAMLNRALPQLREGVRSPKETELRRLLVAAGLPEPEINRDIFDEAGRWVAESDLVHPRWKIAIEYEGDLHFRDPALQRKDVYRYELLQALGWRVIRVTEHDLRHRRTEIPIRVRAAVDSRA